MLAIRLQRIGKRNKAYFRVVVTDSKKAPKSGGYLERVGSYDPHTNKVELNADRITHWISVGAQVSDTVHNLLVKNNVIEGKTRNVLPKKTPIVSETPEEETSAETPTTEEATPQEETPAAEDTVEEATPEPQVEETEASTEEEAKQSA